MIKSRICECFKVNYYGFTYQFLLFCENPRRAVLHTGRPNLNCGEHTLLDDLLTLHYLVVEYEVKYFNFIGAVPKFI